MLSRAPSQIQYSASYGELLVAESVGLDKYWTLPIELREAAIAVHETQSELRAVLDWKAELDAEAKAKQATARGPR